MIALISLVRTVLCMTIAMLVVILVFVIAGLFSKVLAFVFERAVIRMILSLFIYSLLLPESFFTYKPLRQKIPCYSFT